MVHRSVAKGALRAPFCVALQGPCVALHLSQSVKPEAVRASLPAFTLPGEEVMITPHAPAAALHFQVLCFHQPRDTQLYLPFRYAECLGKF